MWFEHDDRFCFNTKLIPKASNEQITCHYCSPVRLRLVHDVHAIDPWDNASRDRLNEGCVHYNADHRWMFGMSEAEQRFDRLLDQYPERLTKRKGYDWRFAELYPDASLDAVYIDSVHIYDEVRAAICRWRPKIKPSGQLFGHDYVDSFPGVTQAVDELCRQPDLVLRDTRWLVYVD